MNKNLTHKEVSSRGGKAKWDKVPPKKRSEIMKRVSSFAPQVKNKSK